MQCSNVLSALCHASREYSVSKFADTWAWKSDGKERGGTGPGGPACSYASACKYLGVLKAAGFQHEEIKSNVAASCK